VEEDWSNYGELGTEGFGVAHKLMQKTIGHYRAVKTIDKRLHAEIHYSRELLVMDILVKLCVVTPEGIHLTGGLLPLQVALVV